MTNGSTLLTESTAVFSPISVVHYEFYDNDKIHELMQNVTDIQSISGEGYQPFGEAQRPGLFAYADNIDTMEFLLTL
jgi:hypothetical protein